MWYNGGMKVKKERQVGRVIGVILVFVIAAVAGVFLVQYVTKTGVFRVPGKLIFEESVSDAEKEEISQVFANVELEKDVVVAAKSAEEWPKLAEGEFLTEILVPVTDFYDVREEVSEVAEAEWISLRELDFRRKLLKVDGEYFLETFDKGARYRVISFSSEKYEEISSRVEKEFFKEWPTRETVLSFAQTGVTAFSRRMNAKMNEVGNGEYFAEKIGEFLSRFDITHTSNEASFFAWPSTSGTTGTPICADNRFRDTLIAIGLDIVELTGNHNQDCGDEAARESVDFYRENGISIVGGGKTAEEAREPLLISKKGTNITFLAYNQSTAGATYDATPGANQYYEENARMEIAAAKERGDFVVVDVQYNECTVYASETEDATCDRADSAAGDQVGLFRKLVEMGADVVVGTSAHQPQTFELYQNGAIYYGLGNLFFDQVYWPGTTRSLVLAHYFYQGKLLQTRVIPTVYDASFQTRVMEDAQWFIERLLSVRP